MTSIPVGIQPGGPETRPVRFVWGTFIILSASTPFTNRKRLAGNYLSISPENAIEFLQPTTLPLLGGSFGGNKQSGVSEAQAMHEGRGVLDEASAASPIPSPDPDTLGDGLSFGRILGMSPVYTVTRNVEGVPTQFSQCIVAYLIDRTYTGEQQVADEDLALLQLAKAPYIFVEVLERSGSGESTVWTMVEDWQFEIPILPSQFNDDYVNFNGRYIYTETPAPGVLTFKTDLTSACGIMGQTHVINLRRAGTDSLGALEYPSGFQTPYPRKSDPTAFAITPAHPDSTPQPPAPYKQVSEHRFTRWIEKHVLYMEMAITRDGTGAVTSLGMTFSEEQAVPTSVIEEGARPDAPSVAAPSANMSIDYTLFGGFRLARTFWTQVKIVV